jgi:hypothetical protein
MARMQLDGSQPGAATPEPEAARDGDRAIAESLALP